MQSFSSFSFVDSISLIEALKDIWANSPAANQMQQNSRLYRITKIILVHSLSTRMLTDPGDFVIDPFAGSCVTVEVADRLNRTWTCVELLEDYGDGNDRAIAFPVVQG